MAGPEDSDDPYESDGGRDEPEPSDDGTYGDPNPPSTDDN